MELTRKQFDVLSKFAIAEEKLSQRQLEEQCKYSLGTINKIAKELTELGYIADGKITSAGFDALEPYRAKRAIFMAAGFGSRLVPVTLNTPKPLIRVNGTRMIDTQLDACLAAGINEIYIIRGYLGEQFDQLLYKYPMIKFLDNPAYNEANNIASVRLARHLLECAYIFESDLIVSNPAVVRKYNYTSNVLGIPKERTDDWVVNVDKDGYVIEEVRGGLNTYLEIGIYYLNSADGARLADHIEEAYNAPGGKELLWEAVPYNVYRGQYKIEVIPCKEEDIVEIDSFKELKMIDKTYDV